MTAVATTIANTLLKHHAAVCGEFDGVAPSDITDSMVAESTISYGILCDRAGVPFLTHSVGTFLGEIAELCEEKGWPPLNSLAVNRTTGMPGEGYDGAAGGALSLWPEQVRECIAFADYPEKIVD